MGLTLGPFINAYVQFFSNGGQLVMLALGGTGVIFLGLSGYALTTRKDFSFMGGFLMVGILVAFLMGICAVLFSIPAMAMAVSAIFILLMSGLILYQTSEMIHGGETNYIMATITLYVAIYNLFTSLLHILAMFAGRNGKTSLSIRRCVLTHRPFFIIWRLPESSSAVYWHCLSRLSSKPAITLLSLEPISRTPSLEHLTFTSILLYRPE